MPDNPILAEFIFHLFMSPFYVMVLWLLCLGWEIIKELRRPHDN